jgi:hypothetical protein
MTACKTAAARIRTNKSPSQRDAQSPLRAKCTRASRSQEPAALSGDRLSNVCGAKGRNRTVDTALFRRVLYRLSYLGTPASVPSAPLARCARRKDGDADGARTHDLRRDRAAL